jgi:hypothetical protein
VTQHRLKIIAVGLILLHLVVSFLHGLAHRGAAVTLTNFESAYVLIVITVAPLMAGLLLWTRWRKAGALLLVASMLGSFGFGAWFHFVAAGSDNVAEVHGPWHLTFMWTAVALAALELLGVLTGLVAAKADTAKPK